MRTVVGKQDRLSGPKTSPAGRVTLVGAGPGAADLITIRGLRRIEDADVLLYDRLAAPELLRYTPPHCVRIDVGKRPSGPSVAQETTNQLLVEHARAGRHVVRLKGGDPFLFGRGGEEVDVCVEAGIACEVVPGISSALAAPASAGIPLTHRLVASSALIVTGHQIGEIDWSAASAADTIVVLMGIGRAAALSDELLAQGLDPETPAALIERATTPEERLTRTTLAEMPGAIERHVVRPPAVMVIGRVAARATDVGWARAPLRATA